MRLIISSILFGFLGGFIGVLLQKNEFVFMFAFVGFLSPGLYTLDRIYEDLSKRQTRDSTSD